MQDPQALICRLVLRLPRLANHNTVTLGQTNRKEGIVVGINNERDIEANMQIGPTDQGMVRIFIEADGVEVPMDFEPEEADEIAEEIKAASMAARAVKTRG
jgi:hypothetical protein